MGQYWLVVNLDKKEFINPSKLGTGLKLWEQLATHPGTGAALIVLLAAEREPRGGGDFDIDENWHGPERKFPEHNVTPGPMPEGYSEIAKRTIGRWAGDRIAIVGDYAEDSDLPNSPIPASEIFDKCSGEGHIEYDDNPEGALYQCGVEGDPNYGKYAHWVIDTPPEFRDISDDVCRVIEHELGGKFEGDVWREFKEMT